jgi:hypothetical protein
VIVRVRIGADIIVLRPGHRRVRRSVMPGPAMEHDRCRHSLYGKSDDQQPGQNPKDLLKHDLILVQPTDAGFPVASGVSSGCAKSLCGRSNYGSHHPKANRERPWLCLLPHRRPSPLLIRWIAMALASSQSLPVEATEVKVEVRRADRTELSVIAVRSAPRTVLRRLESSTSSAPLYFWEEL